jgi:hypothetical protein
MPRDTCAQSTPAVERVTHLISKHLSSAPG